MLNKQNLQGNLASLVAWRHQAITWANVDPNLWRQMVSLGLNELNKQDLQGHLASLGQNDLSKNSFLGTLSKQPNSQVGGCWYNKEFEPEFDACNYLSVPESQQAGLSCRQEDLKCIIS